MKWTATCLVIALIAMTAIPANADVVDDLVAAIKSGDKGKIEGALDKAMGATPDKFNVSKATDAIKSAASGGNKEVVMTLCDLLGKRHDAEPQKVMPPLLGSMKKGADEINSAIEKMFKLKTCHSVNPKEETWKAKTSAWRALWNQIKGLKHPNMVFKGMGKAGLKLPPKDSSAASLGGVCNELLKGLDHAELHVRFNCFQFLAHILQPKNFNFDAEGEAKERVGQIQEMKVFYGSNKDKVHAELKKMIDHILSGK